MVVTDVSTPFSGSHLPPAKWRVNRFLENSERTELPSSLNEQLVTTLSHLIRLSMHAVLRQLKRKLLKEKHASYIIT